MRRRSFLVVSAVVASLLGGSLAAAQDATPAPAQQPIIPAPNQCTVAPRDVAFFAQFVGTPDTAMSAATPADAATFQMPAGEPPDRATRQGVLDTIRQVAACLNAGNFLAFYALYTDNYLVTQAAMEPLAEEDLAFFSTTPVPLEGEGRVAILAIIDVRVLPDGRAAALVDYFDPFEASPGPVRFLFILVEQDGRWLIDEEIAFGRIDESQVGMPEA